MTSAQELPGPLRNLLIEQCRAIWEAALQQPEIEQVALFWMDDQGAQIASPLLKVTGRWDRFVLIEPELPHSYDARAVTVARSLQIRSALHEPFRPRSRGTPGLRK